MKLVRNLKLSMGVLAVASLAACGGGGSGSETGTLKLAVTDAPACGYDSVNVTIEKVRVHQSDSANPDDPNGWSEIVLNPALQIDLLAWQNGDLKDLGEVTLPTGRYNQMRMVLADNKDRPASSPANWVVLTTDNPIKPKIALDTPSAPKSGVKAKQFDIDIGANQLANFVIDFDACKSVVVAGNSGKYLLKPQLTVIPRYLSGVSGFVAPALATTGFTNLSLQQGGVVVKATAPASNGTFMLQPVAPGNYTLVMTAPDRPTSVVTNVVVAAEKVTSVNTALTALNPAVSVFASGTVNGTATASPITETSVPLVRVLQPLSSALTGDIPPAITTIEVAGGFVNSITGRYSYPLVVNAPLVAPYGTSPLVFVADSTAAGRYTLEASLTGFDDKKKTTLTPLASGATITTHYTFP